MVFGDRRSCYAEAGIRHVKKSLTFELATTAEVNNPFGYAREYVQDKTGARRTHLLLPHTSDAAPWWQGENARLASLATAARLAAPHYKDDPTFQRQLQTYATNQLNWILGLNPFDSTMLNGVGRNNPRYMFFASYEFTNAPGGISNGITGGFKDESDIDYNLTYKQTGGDNDWRWGEPVDSARRLVSDGGCHRIAIRSAPSAPEEACKVLWDPISSTLETISAAT